MKKFFYFAICALMVISCQEEKKEPVAAVIDQSDTIDSLQQVIEGRDNEINEFMSTLNQIQEGFRLITEAEGRVTLAKNGEGSDKAAKIKSDIEFIQNKMKTNRLLTIFSLIPAQFPVIQEVDKYQAKAKLF